MESLGRNNELNFYAFAPFRLYSDDDFFSLPEEVQEQVNAHANEFRSQQDMRDFVKDLMRRA